MSTTSIPVDIPTGREVADYFYNPARVKESIRAGKALDSLLKPRAIARRLAEDARRDKRKRQVERLSGGKLPHETWLGRLSHFLARTNDKDRCQDLSALKMPDAMALARSVLLMHMVLTDPDADDRKPVLTEWQRVPWNKRNGRLIEKAVDLAAVFVDDGESTDANDWTTRRSLQAVAYRMGVLDTQGESTWIRNIRAAWDWVKTHDMAEGERRRFESATERRVAATPKPPAPPSEDALLRLRAVQTQLRGDAANLDRRQELIERERMLLEKREAAAKAEADLERTRQQGQQAVTPALAPTAPAANLPTPPATDTPGVPIPPVEASDKNLLPPHRYQAPTKAIDAGVAQEKYDVTKKTLSRMMKAGKLKDLRENGHAANAALVLDEHEIEQRYKQRPK